ncbi:hypothetical protein Gpo141_00013238 [Globisporangium polare]
MEVDMLFFPLALLGVCFPLYFLRKFRYSSDHRLDAEEGYNRCKLCGFENFKRFSSCSICGNSVAAPHVEFVDGIVRRNTTTSASQRGGNSRTSCVSWQRSASVGHKSYVEIVAT